MMTKMMTTYNVNTDKTEFRTKSAAKAASVAVAQRKNGLDPSVYAVVDRGDGVSVRRAEIGRSQKATAANLVAASK